MLEEPAQAARGDDGDAQQQDEVVAARRRKGPLPPPAANPAPAVRLGIEADRILNALGASPGLFFRV